MVHFTPERNFNHLETPVLAEALGLVDAQIWSAEDNLRALNVARDAMLGVLASRGFSGGNTHAED